MLKMKFSKFVSQSLFCLENGNLKFSLEWDSLEKRHYKTEILLGTKKDTI